MSLSQVRVSHYTKDGLFRESFFRTSRTYWGTYLDVLLGSHLSSNRTLREINQFATEQAARNWFKTVLVQKDDVGKVQEYRRKLKNALDRFTVCLQFCCPLFSFIAVQLKTQINNTVQQHQMAWAITANGMCLKPKRRLAFDYYLAPFQLQRGALNFLKKN